MRSSRCQTSNLYSLLYLFLFDGSSVHQQLTNVQCRFVVIASELGDLASTDIRDGHRSPATNNAIYLASTYYHFSILICFYSTEKFVGDKIRLNIKNTFLHLGSHKQLNDDMRHLSLQACFRGCRSGRIWVPS